MKNIRLAHLALVSTTLCCSTLILGCSSGGGGHKSGSGNGDAPIVTNTGKSEDESDSRDITPTESSVGRTVDENNIEPPQSQDDTEVEAGGSLNMRAG
jgi:hypothetical protein